MTEATAIDGEYRSLGGPVTAGFAGVRVDAFLAREFPFLSRAGWQRRIEEGGLHVNGGPVRAVSARLRTGDRLSLFYPQLVEPEVDRGVRVLWEDRGVMAAFKPGNLPMHENGPYKKNTFAEILGELCGREWSAVHRLDRETSGIVICGATAALRAQLSRDLNGRRMRKEYLALVRGAPSRAAWTEDGPIGDLASSEIRIKKWVVEGGLSALTHFNVLETRGEMSLLRARPVTGRTNQIRIHAAYAGHVLFGDKLYHPDEAVFLEYFEEGQTENVTERTGFPRLCLHATSMELTSPVTRGLVRIECPLPDDMAAFWDSAGRRDS